MFTVMIYEIDTRLKEYKIIDSLSKSFNDYKDAVRYAKYYTLKSKTFLRGYIINEVICG